MKETIKLVAVLTVICVVSGLLLAWISGVTAEPIAEAAREEKLSAIRGVLPAFDNEPDRDVVEAVEDGKTWVFYVARREGAFVGAAVETSSANGYGGTIRVMLGITADGRVKDIAVLQHAETPGLGAKIADEPFRKQFRNREIARTRWAVRKDGGDIDHITAATISSRAVVEAVAAGLEAYGRHEERIRGGM